MADTFTARQVAAMLLDYNWFARLVCGLQPDPWQSDLLLHPRRPTLVCTSRQVGKTQTAATLAAAHSVLHEGHQSLIISTGHSHAGYVLARVKECIRAAEVGGLCTVTGDSASRVELGNGSVVFVCGSNPRSARGYSVSGLLLIDEAAHLPDVDGGQTGVIDSVLPTLSAAGGTPLLLSTPNGYQNRFSELWHSDDPYWHRVEVKWTECPRLHGPIIESLRRAMPAAVFQQEYECSFISSGSQLFDWDALQSARCSDDEPLEPDPCAEPDTVTALFDMARLKSTATRGRP